MTNGQLEMLQQWMQEKFTERDVASDGFRAELDAMKNTMQRVESDVADFKQTAADIKDLAEFFRETQQTWHNVTRITGFFVTKRGGIFIVGAIFVGNWLADMVRALHWPF